SSAAHQRNASRSFFVVFANCFFSDSTCFEISCSSLFASAPAFANLCAVLSTLPAAVPIFTATFVNPLFFAIGSPSVRLDVTAQPSYRLPSQPVNESVHSSVEPSPRISAYSAPLRYLFLPLFLSQPFVNPFCLPQTLQRDFLFSLRIPIRVLRSHRH